ncbi:hypothetical protein TWF569_001288 [Orbilia oligospora]|uniref:Uncharacterized protein n=1 Tax=Orbilia oligospora TaxID=2813651 RepID=A0A7C8JIY4_ORBOL|nr:hypothetical protein TWF706_007740 [Orbilia oligospora]KAF3105325.1 hypothetical protein TWF102_002254 [Orbilia oligospora]KAF3112486.1 hypothetical protein TWF103_003248 [Orbilia oligospora]KAF3124371.1 hypothetical protein TWF569_001288 [Orbilia oligospora]KAF3124723.1 hypothetical protein TWF703_011229 [Orbilia oligospora]
MARLFRRFESEPEVYELEFGETLFGFSKKQGKKLTVCYFYDSGQPMEAAFWDEFYRRILRSYSISLNTNLFFATRGDYLRNRDLAYEFDNIPVPCFVLLWEYATSLRIVNATDKDVEKKVRDLIERTAKISPDTTVLPTATRITEALASTCLCTPTQCKFTLPSFNR